MTQLAAHPLAELFPLIEGDDFDALVADICEHGVRERIDLLDGAILDGRNRYNALLYIAEAGQVLGPGWGHRAGEPLANEHLAPDNPWFRKFNRFIDGDPLPWVLSKNLKRRHLDESQRAMVAAKLANMNVGRPPKIGTDPVPAHIPPIGGISARATAAMLNVGTRSVERAKAVLQDGAEDLQRAVEQGKVAVSTAEALTQLPKDEQADIVARGEKEILEAAKGIRSRRRQVRFAEVNEKLARISEGNRELPTGQRFPILYLDPASRFVSGFGDRSIENHYPTMTWEEIDALPIAQLATDAAVMFCWSTVPQLANTLRFIERCGFTYVSEWCWDKVDQGTGYWAFNEHEPLLIATRGNFPAPLPGTQPRSVHHEKKTEHSVKPAWFAEQIERIWPRLPKVELFARAPRPGWAAWGNQADTVPAAKEPEAEATAPTDGCGVQGSSRPSDGRSSDTASPAAEPTAAPFVSSPSADRFADLDIPAFLRRSPPTSKGEAA